LPLLPTGNLSDEAGFEALRNLSTQSNVIVLTAEVKNKSVIVEALQLGARGLVVKGCATEFLLKAIQTVMMGDTG
jgi:DNA-binding NarL/FixJ family response regulator